MYLSDRDLAWAIETGKLIVDPAPEKIDASSIDLHLDAIEYAKVWNIPKFMEDQTAVGIDRPQLRIAKYNLASFSGKYLAPPPPYDANDKDIKVGVHGPQIVVKPLGFLLWQTRERVGTPDTNADLICFIDGKSTRARAGIVVHLTAPTIHASWSGKITLEIFNAGPFDIVLEAGDVIAQIVVSKVTSSPMKGVRGDSHTYGQTEVGGTNTT
jgi:dCTP deaminase